MTTAYRLTKQLCRHTQASVSIVKDKEENPLTAEETQTKRWVKHFSEVLNIESVTITIDPPPPHTTNDDLDIATGFPTLQEVIQAIQENK